MENRFSFKDLVPVVLLVVLIVIGAVGFVSAGRQADEIQAISTQMEKMQGEVERLRSQLETLGGKLEAFDAATAAPPSPEPTDAESQLPAPTTD